MTRYSPDQGRNNAYLLLSTMSPDQVRSIINLCATEGASILPTLAENEGAPKVLGLLSSEFVHPEDFPHVLLGLTTMYFAAYRDTAADFDFYEKILTKGTMMPKHLASAMAEKIETRDLIGGKKADGSKVNDVMKAYRSLAEKFRRAVNWFVRPLGWENDQQQDFDLDRLYEIKLLGQAIDEASSYGRLLTSQQKIQGAIGAGAFGDVADNPVDAAELDIISALAPEVGSPIPIKLFGTLKNLVAKMREMNASNIGRVLSASGEGKSGGNVDPAYQAAAKRITTQDADSLSHCVPPDATKSEIGDIMQNRYGRKQSGLDGSAEVVRQHFGDEAADAFATGDVSQFLQTLSDLDDSDYVSTGDPQLDQEIVAQTLAEIGDAYDDQEEIGGLLKRLRVKNNLKKAARLSRRNTRKKAKQVKRNMAQNALAASRRKVQDARYAMDDYSEGLEEPEEQDEQVPYQEEDYSQPLDYANEEDLGFDAVPQ